MGGILYFYFLVQHRDGTTECTYLSIIDEHENGCSICCFPIYAYKFLFECIFIIL